MTDREMHLTLKLVLVVYILVLLAACGALVCDFRAEAADYGSYATACDMDDVDCTGLADDYLLQYDAASGTFRAVSLATVADGTYARLDGATTTGPWTFGHDVYGPATGSCTEPTAFTVNAGCVHCTAAKCGVEVTANVDITEGGCPGGSLLFADVTVGPTGFVCYPGDTGGDALFTVPGVGPSLDYGVDDIRLCIIHMGGGVGVSAVIPSSQACADLAAFFGMGPEIVVGDDPDFYSFNATTCRYDFTPDEGITLIDGWNAAEVVTDSQAGHYWQIDDTGNATFADLTAEDTSIADLTTSGTVGIQTTPQANTGLYVETVRSGVNGDDSVTAMLFGTANTITQNVTGAIETRGFYGFSQLNGGYNYPLVAGGAGAAQYFGTAGTLGAAFGLNAQVMHDGAGGTIDEADVYRGQLYVWNSGSINEAWYLRSMSYSQMFTSSTTGHIGNLNVFEVRDISGSATCSGGSNDGALCDEDASCPGGTCSGADDTGKLVSGNGLVVREQTDPSIGFGIDIGWRGRFLDDISMYFGTDLDIALSSSTADQLDLTPSTTDGDVTLNVVGTGSVKSNQAMVIAGSLTPGTHNAYDLGVTDTRWQDLFLSGNADVDGTLDVASTSTLRDNVTLSTDKKLYYRDTATYMYSPSANALGMVAPDGIYLATTGSSAGLALYNTSSPTDPYLVIAPDYIMPILAGMDLGGSLWPFDNAWFDGTVDVDGTLDVASTSTFGSTMRLTSTSKFYFNTGWDVYLYSADGTDMGYRANDSHVFWLYDTGASPASRVALTVNQTEIKPGGYFDDIMDLGTDGYRFDDLFLAGDIDAEGSLTVDGTIKTTSGDAWDLGDYTAGAPTADGYLTVAVEGVTYRVAVDKQ